MELFGKLDFGALWAFLLLWLVVVPTPGANSLMIAHTALTHRARQVAAALAGNVLGVLIWASCALFGLALMLEAAPAARRVLQVLGGAYLVYFGSRLVRRTIGRTEAPELGAGVSTSADPPLRASFGLGLVTALSNAQAVFFMTSIYAATGITRANRATGLATLLIIGACNATYLGLLGWLLRRPAPRAFYWRHRHWLERVIGVTFALLGIRLVAKELFAY